MTFLVGIMLEKIRIPWVFSALLIGLALSIRNPFSAITSSSSFVFLAQLGMYFLLFIIGFELDIKKVMASKSFIFRTTFAVTLLEAILGTLLVHYLFGVPWTISILVAASFATVGEEILLPVLDEFRLVKTKFGQTVIGIGALGSIVEVMVIVAASIIVGRSAGHTYFNIWSNLLILGSLFALAFVLVGFHKYLVMPFKYKDIPSLFIFVLFFIFLFIGVGGFVESAPLGAFLAGIALRNSLPKKVLDLVDSEIRTMAFGLFAPIFFLWVGLDTDLSYILKAPFLILLIVAMAGVTKMAGSYLTGKRLLGPKKSLILGMCLSIKFSTSIVIIKLLLENGMIEPRLYSIMIGSIILLQFSVPFVLSYFLSRNIISAPKAQSVL